MGKKCKKFKPFVIPRYLPGSVNKELLVKDLLRFNDHRYRVFSAKYRVDDSAPKMDPFRYFDVRKLANDAMRLKEIDNKNKELLIKINTINRMGGRVDTYNPKAYRDSTKWKQHQQLMEKIALYNVEIYHTLNSATSLYALALMNEFWRKVKQKLRHTSKFPIIIFDKPNLDVLLQAQPSISAHLNIEKGTRPLCFLEFQVKDGLYLGKVIIELYHDFVPVTVQNFLEICKGENNLTYKNCIIHRIVPGKFLETGDITHGTGKGGCSIYGKNFDEENHKLKHTRAGVLSMVRVDNQKNNSKFSISFSEITQYDHKNVVFGNVTSGISVIYKIQDYGRKVGRPNAEIIISNCGEILKDLAAENLK